MDDQHKEGGFSSGHEGKPPLGYGIDPNDKKKLTSMGISYEEKDKDDAKMAGKVDAAAAESAKVKDCIFYIGPSTKIVKFSVRKRTWEAIKLDQRSSYRGNVKQFSLVTVPEKNMILMTGGVSVATCSPLGFVYEFYGN